MVKICHHCGAKMMEDRHSLNDPMVKALWDMSKLVNAASEADIPMDSPWLTRNQRSNWSVLMFFGLTEHVLHSDGSQKKAWWRITGRGWRFLNGKIRLRKACFTYRRKLVRFDKNSPWVGIKDFPAGDIHYTQKEEHLATWQPHIDPSDVSPAKKKKKKKKGKK